MSAYMSCYSEWMAVTFEAYYDSVPDNERYKFLIDLYSDGGDRIGSIRKAMRTARKYGSPVLPPDFGDVITVYRAGDEPVNKAAYRLSWTTDLEKAKWFMNYSGRMKKADMHLYTGEIRREKVIAYFDGRSEKEKSRNPWTVIARAVGSSKNRPTSTGASSSTSTTRAASRMAA